MICLKTLAKTKNNREQKYLTNLKENKMVKSEGFLVKPDGQLKRLRKNIERIDVTIKRQRAFLEIASEKNNVDLNRLTSLEMALKYFESCKSKYELELKRLTGNEIDQENAESENC